MRQLRAFGSIPGSTQVRSRVLLCLLVVVVAAVPCLGALGAPTSLGPIGGAVRSLVVDPRDSNRVHVALDVGGMFRGDDGGTTWARPALFAPFPPQQRLDLVVVDPSIWSGPPFPSPSKAFGPVAVDPHAPDRMLLGVQASGTSAARVFRTGEGGGFWGEPLPGSSVAEISTPRADPDFEGTGYLTGGGKIYRSDTLALSWLDRTTALPPGVAAGVRVIDPISTVNLCLTTNDGVYASSDRAATFSRLGNEINGQLIRTIAVDSANPQRVLASVEGGGLWEITVPSIFSDGFETGDTSAWSVAEP